jgi:hypothetical protein
LGEILIEIKFCQTPNAFFGGMRIRYFELAIDLSSDLVLKVTLEEPSYHGGVLLFSLPDEFRRRMRPPSHIRGHRLGD